MGVSLHLFVERREGDGWVFVPSSDRDWFSNHYGRTSAQLLTGFCDNDGYKPVVDWRQFPADASSGLIEATGWRIDCDSCTWLLLSELESYDFDQSVTLMSRIYTHDELRERGWLGNGDGTPYDDVQRHRSGNELRHQFADGYVERQYPVRSQMRDLFEVIQNIRTALPDVPSDQIRLTAFFSV